VRQNDIEPSYLATLLGYVKLLMLIAGMLLGPVGGVWGIYEGVTRNNVFALLTGMVACLLSILVWWKCPPVLIRMWRERRFPSYW